MRLPSNTRAPDAPRDDAYGLDGAHGVISERHEFPVQDDDSTLRLSLLDVVYGQTKIGAGASVPIAGLLSGALWSEVDHARLMAWMGVVIVAMVIRYSASFAYRNRSDGTNVLVWEWIFSASLTISSLMWGVGALFIQPENSRFHEAIIYVFLVGMSGGAALSYAARQAAAIVSLLSVLAPVTLVFLFKGDIAFYCMAGGGLMMMLIGTAAILRLGGFIRRSVELSQELDKARRVAELKARTDDLTGIFNRGAFYEMGGYLLAQADRLKHPIALLLIDVDYFKQINDNHGHATGDAVLRALTGLMLESSREVDVVGRLGGR